MFEKSWGMSLWIRTSTFNVPNTLFFVFVFVFNLWPNFTFQINWHGTYNQLDQIAYTLGVYWIWHHSDVASDLFPVLPEQATYIKKDTQYINMKYIFFSTALFTKICFSFNVDVFNKILPICGTIPFAWSFFCLIGYSMIIQRKGGSREGINFKIM